MWMLAIGLMQGRGKVEGVSGRECINEMQGGQRLRSALLRCKLAQDGARGFWECVIKTQTDLGQS